jgi:hypothetical protein
VSSVLHRQAFDAGGVERFQKRYGKSTFTKAGEAGQGEDEASDSE